MRQLKTILMPCLNSSNPNALHINQINTSKKITLTSGRMQTAFMASAVRVLATAPMIECLTSPAKLSTNQMRAVTKVLKAKIDKTCKHAARNEKCMWRMVMRKKIKNLAFLTVFRSIAIRKEFRQTINVSSSNLA